MNDSVLEEVLELLDRADDLPYGPARTGLVEEAVRLADAHADVTSGFRARTELLDSAMSGGRSDLLIVHYPWLLAQFDRNPDHFDEFDLLWQFKWVIANAIDFPQITRKQLDGMFDEMKTRFRRYGAGNRELASFQMHFATQHGSPDEAKKQYKKFKQLRRDDLSDCEACEVHTAVLYHLGQRDAASALSAAEKVLDGRLTCHAVPENTIAELLEALFDSGDNKRAVQLHRKGLKLAIESRSLTNLAAHIRFLALTDNLPDATKLFEKFLPEAVGSFEPRAQFEYFLAGRFLCDRHLAVGTKGGIRVPKELRTDDSRKLSLYIGSLRKWLDTRTHDLAQQFDTRNGNTNFTQRIRDIDASHAKVRPVAIGKR